MKTLARTILPFVTLIAIFSACKKDEDPVNPIVGTWKVSGVSFTGCDDPADNASEDVPCTASDCQKWILKADGSITIEITDTGDLTTETATYTVADGKITICDGTDCETPLTYTIVGSTLTINFGEFLAGCDLNLNFTKS